MNLTYAHFPGVIPVQSTKIRSLHIPALRSDPMALSGVSRRKQILSSKTKP